MKRMPLSAIVPCTSDRGKDALIEADQPTAWFDPAPAVVQALAEGLIGLGFDVIPPRTNALLCRLPSKLPDARVLVTELAVRGLLIADAARLGLADNRMVSIAVKDRNTNLAMLEILRARLSETFQPKFSLSSPLPHDL